jgi:hypothetical protein
MEYDKLVEQTLNESKHPKSEANYVAYPVDGHRCDQCTMWVAPDGCTAVSGKIKPSGYCDWWKKSKRKA